MICPVCGTEYAPDIRFCPRDGSLLRPLENGGDKHVGTVIDQRYYLLEKLGQGGMGEVYLGEHVRTRRRCAVKIVRPLLSADPEAIGRFIREATNAGRINHPHVATVYDFGETDDGLLYLAMEYVEGEPLSKVLEREGALIPARAVEIARQVTEAVGAAHELGIVHRDLKPSNIMVAQDRKGGDLVKVVDFGIARATSDEQQRLTRTGLVVGTPEYMSPEQLIGDPVDGRADIYALGCILYQMLTGEHAFGGPTAQVITRRLTEPPPRPREKNPAIPKPLDEVIVTALGRTPKERFQTMDAMREALLAAPAQPVTTGPRRLAAWLGLAGSKEEPEADTAVAEPVQVTAERTSGERPAAAPVATPPPIPAITLQPPSDDAPAEVQTELLHTTEPITEPRSPPMPDPEPVEALPDPLPSAEIEEPELFDQTGEVERSGEDGGVDEMAEGSLAPTYRKLEGDPPRWVEPSPRRRNVSRIALGVGVVVVLLIAVVALLGPGRDRGVADTGAAANPAPVIPEPPPTPEPDAAVQPLDESVLADLRTEISRAEQERADLQFAAAIGRLRSVESRLATLSAEYPASEEVRILADSAQSQLARVEGQCTSLRRVALQRNEPPPVCEVSP